MQTRIVNPFYVLLMVAGTLFTLTAIAFGVMSLRETHGSPDWMDANAGSSTGAISSGVPDGPQDHPFDRIMKRYGMTWMLAELAVLAVGTFAAIGTDSYWESRAAQQNKS